MMVSNKSGLIVNVSPHKQIIRALKNIPHQIERSGYDELTLTYADELRKQNISILSLLVGPIKTLQIDNCDTGIFKAKDDNEFSIMKIKKCFY